MPQPINKTTPIHALAAEFSHIRTALNEIDCTCPSDDDDGKWVHQCPHCRPARALGRIADAFVLPRKMTLGYRVRLAGEDVTRYLTGDDVSTEDRRDAVLFRTKERARGALQMTSAHWRAHARIVRVRRTVQP